MGLTAWVFIGIALLLLVIGFFEWREQIIKMVYEGGAMLAIYFVLLLALVVTRVLIRDYAHDYIGVVNWILIFYIAIPIVYRFLKPGGSD